VKYAWGLVFGLALAVSGAGVAGAQCTTCYSSSNQPTTSTMRNSAGTYVPMAGTGTGYRDPSTGTYGVGGSALAPGQTLPTVAGSSIGIGQYGTFLNTGASDMRLGIGGYSPAYGGPSLIDPNGAHNGWYSASPLASDGAALAYASVVPTNFAVGEWHPQSFYGPTVPEVPGRAMLMADGSTTWPRDPQAPSGR
jgi:hypothetical protein